MIVGDPKISGLVRDCLKFGFIGGKSFSFPETNSKFGPSFSASMLIFQGCRESKSNHRFGTPAVKPWSRPTPLRPSLLHQGSAHRRTIGCIDTRATWDDETKPMMYRKNRGSGNKKVPFAQGIQKMSKWRCEIYQHQIRKWNLPIVWLLEVCNRPCNFWNTSVNIALMFPGCLGKLDAEWFPSV